MFKRWLLFSILVLMLVSKPTLAQPGTPLAHLDHYESKHYHIYTTLPETRIEPYAKHMDLVWEAYIDLMGKALPLPRDYDKPFLYLLEDREEYIETLSLIGIDAAGSGGIFFTRPYVDENGPQLFKGLATWVEPSRIPSLRSRSISLLQHEGFHQYAHAAIGRELPLWANEGLAEYFSHCLVIRRRVMTGIVDAHSLRSVQDAIENRNFIEFDELLDITSEQWWANMRPGNEGGKGSLQYYQSWSIVYFLFHGDRGRYRKAFTGYLKALAEGEEHAAAFEDAFGKNSRRDFRRKWLKYMMEAEPDRMGEAIDNMSFIAGGYQWLDDNQEEFAAQGRWNGYPPNWNAIKDKLQSHGFYWRWPTAHGGEIYLRSSNDDLFTYQVRRNYRLPFSVEMTRDRTLPPRIMAPQLSPRPIVVWERYNGELDYRIEFR